MATETNEDELRTVNVVKLEGLSYYIEDTNARENIAKAQSAIATNTKGLSDIKTKVDGIADDTLKLKVPIDWTKWNNTDWIGSKALRTIQTKDESIVVVDKEGNLLETTADNAGYLALSYNTDYEIKDGKLTQL